MDHSTKSIAEFATRLDYADLPADVVHDCKRRIIDTIGCAHRGVRRGAVAHRAGGGDAHAGRGRRVGDRHVAPDAAGACRLRQQRRQPLPRRQRHLSGRRRPSERQPAAGPGDRAGEPRQRADRDHRRSCWPTRCTAICSAPSRCESTRSTMCSTTRSSSAAGAAKVLGLSLRADRQRHRARRGAQSRHRHQPPRPSHHVEGLRRRQRRAERRVRRDHGDRKAWPARRRRSRTA